MSSNVSTYLDISPAAMESMLDMSVKYALQSVPKERPNAAELRQAVSTRGGGLGVSFVAAVVLIEAGNLPTPARATAALLPAIAMAAFLWVEISFLSQLDELHRRVQLEALAVAFPLAILLVFTVGSLERAGVHIEGFERPRDLWPLVVIPYPIGLLFAWRRYQ